MDTPSSFRWLTRLLRIVLLAALGVAAMFALLQHKMIYYPSPYDAATESMRPKSMISLRSQTPEGKQVAFYLPPQQPSAEKFHLWVFFGGNAMLALHWLDFIIRYPDPHTGFLLMDYPGYGKCKGTASPDTILESTEKAFERLAQELQVSPQTLENSLNLFGHSLGAAAALQFAVKHQVHKIVLSSAFTSLQEMAKQVVGRWLSYLILHHFDNKARLTELSHRPNPPVVKLFHGDQDEVIPVGMGQELSQMFPNLIEYHEIEFGTHNTLLYTLMSQFHQAMLDYNE
ncbi:hypothetical protein WDW89_02170 [Deltaproteobacteria bacterium TL4]